MSVRLEHSDEAGGFRLIGELNAASVPALERDSSPAFAGKPQLTIDLGAVSRADSAGLALLVEWVRWARSRGQQIRYRGVPEQMSKIIRVSGLDNVLPIARDEEAI